MRRKRYAFWIGSLTFRVNRSSQTRSFCGNQFLIGSHETMMLVFLPGAAIKRMRRKQIYKFK